MSRERAARRTVALADHLQSAAPRRPSTHRCHGQCGRASSTRAAPSRSDEAAPAAALHNRSTGGLTAAPAAALQAGPSATSVEGRPILARVCGTGEEDQAILILGGIHGNEPAGVTLCEALCDYLARARLGPAHRKVIVAAALNPDGLVRNTRENARGIDLNRNFATSNRESARAHGSAALSEPEAQFVAHLIARFSPVAIVSVHQPLACVDYDGPAEALAAAMARECGLPVEKLVNSRPYPGSLGTYLLQSMWTYPPSLSQRACALPVPVPACHSYVGRIGTRVWTKESPS